jgi:hypothetical protein
MRFWRCKPMTVVSPGCVKTLTSDFRVEFLSESLTGASILLAAAFEAEQLRNDSIYLRLS